MTMSPDRGEPIVRIAARGDGPEKQRLRVAAEVWWVESHWVILEFVKHGIGWAFASAGILVVTVGPCALLGALLLGERVDARRGAGGLEAFSAAAKAEQRPFVVTADGLE